MSARERGVARLAAVARRVDANPTLLAAAQRARERLPGDSRFGDPLSTAGAPDLLARQLAAVRAERPSVVRELGFGALQLWQGLSEAQGRGYGDREVAIMFTDLIDFSQWALEAGDSLALELLRRVDELVSAAVYAHDGSVVKRMGDGLMAVFEEPRQAIAAGHEAQLQLARLHLNGHRARLRVGIHVGRPRKLGGDYFGVDVNVAARVMAAADAGEVLVSGAAGSRLGEDETILRARGRLAAKGAPQDLEVYLAEPGATG